MKKFEAFFISFLFCCAVGLSPVMAQEEIDVDAAAIDTVQEADTVDIFQREHDPRKAWQYSAIIPGLGQAYNKKYWKIPIIYAAGAAAYYYYYESARRYHALHDIYVEYNNFGTVSMKARQQYYEVLGEERVLTIDAQDLANQLEDNIPFQQQHMERGIILMFAVYFANIVDALVDGYFFSYDVDSDLAFDVKPGLWQGPDINSTTPTLTFRFTF